MKTRDWDKLYRTYYKNYKKELAKTPDLMESIYSKSEFRIMYSSLEKDRVKEVLAGKRKVLNITQDLIRNQRLYKYSQKQAVLVQKALEDRTGHKYSIKALRLGRVQQDEKFWDAVREHQRSNSPLTVGQVFFGSI